MSANRFETTNFGWQIHQFQQRLSEWLELQLTARVNETGLSWLSWLFELLRWMLFEPPLWLKALYWLLLGFLLILLALGLLRLSQPYLRLLGFQLTQGTRQATPTPTVELTIDAWLKRSRQSYLDGNYAQACRCIYMALLQLLNDKGIAPHQTSRTDGEYLKLIQQLPLATKYQKILLTHEQLCFSNSEISSEQFESCQQAYQEIENTKHGASNR